MSADTQETRYKVSVAFPEGIGAEQRIREGITVHREYGYEGPLTAEQKDAIEADPYLHLSEVTEGDNPDEATASQIIEDARKEAEQITEDAKSDAETVTNAAKEAAQQAADDAKAKGADAIKAAQDQAQKIIDEAKAEAKKITDEAKKAK